MPVYGVPRGYWGGTAARAESDDTKRLAAHAHHAPRVSFDTFITKYFEWKPGEHVTLIGPTGQGKSVMATNLMQTRQFVVCLGTKPADDTLESYLDHYGFVRYPEWRSVSPLDVPKRIIWPDLRRVTDEQAQAIYRTALMQVYLEGSWVLNIDEMSHMSNPLHDGGYGLKGEFKKILTQGRSIKISMIGNAQRPRFVPLEALSQATHLFFWRTNDDEDLARIGGLGTMSSSLIRDIVQRLDRYEALYINVRDDIMVRTKAPSPYTGKEGT